MTRPVTIRTEGTTNARAPMSGTQPIVLLTSVMVLENPALRPSRSLARPRLTPTPP